MSRFFDVQTIAIYPERLVLAAGIDFFWARSCLYVKSDSVHSCTETFFIFQEAGIDDATTPT
jgi:hypothetical protein